MSELKKKYIALTKIFRGENITMEFSGNVNEEVHNAVDRILNMKPVTPGKILNYYAKECTGYTPAEIRELILKGRSRVDALKISEAVKEAVRYKMICGLLKEKN